ncbi:MAG: YeiH family putative sulfate export transporter [Nitrospirae bacterium]|nr:YeiH family putative sulfate export transporter [Nitrospirota bacterium]
MGIHNLNSRRGRRGQKIRETHIWKLIPGILLVLAIAVPSVYIHKLYGQLSAVAIAIVVGILVRNLFGLPEKGKAGVNFSVKEILRLAIILLGVHLSFVEMLKISGSSLGIITILIIMAIFLVRYISHKLGLPDRLGTLIAVGTSICGVSAIVATSPAIEATEEETSFAVATITIFGLMAVFVYPIIGYLLHMSDTLFGIWAGAAVNDTSQAVATGFIYSDVSGSIATVVKLTRNLFMAPVIVLLSYLHIVKENRKNGTGDKEKKIDHKKAFPVFVLGFIGMAILRTLGVFPDEVISIIKTTAGFLIVTAIAGVGLGTNLASMKKIGLKPFYAGLSAALLMAIISITLIKLFKIA